jgi:hypothetical protein
MTKRDAYLATMMERRRMWRALADLSLGRSVVMVEVTKKLAEGSAKLLKRRAAYYGIRLTPGQVRAERIDTVTKTDAAFWPRYSFYGFRRVTRG